MILTYGITILIVGTWVYKMISEKAFIVRRTPLDIPLLLFLATNILSTILSIDLHTSIWGYYSRSNGGLLSIISYLLLFWAYVANMDKAKVLTTLKFALLSGFIVSFWGIFEHFGVSLSCIILRGEFSDSCWIQDVQARVFASLGQPNWMAAYLAMLIFPALYFLLAAKNRFQTITYYLLTITYYLAFTFTYSRGPTLGLIGGMVVFLVMYIICHPERAKRPKDIIIFFASLRMTSLFGVLVSFLIINLLFGSALTSFRLVSKFASPPRPSIALPQNSSTQLENGGTESGQIRFIVWKGALEIFKHYPILGSGLETFAYSYYQYRPTEHNQTSEWDFLYNKAHNEYLNYLSTTGILGFGTYMLVIGSFIYWSFKKISGSKPDILVVTLLASFVSYLIYNFFLFSVVIIAVFFYLFPALVFVATDSTKIINYKQSLRVKTLKLQITNWIYKKPLYTQAAKVMVIFVTLYLIYGVFKLWTADSLFAKGERASELGNPGRAYNLISQAIDLNSSEPFYKSELAFSAAQAATALKESDATLSGQLKDEAVYQINQVLNSSPKNVSYWRTAIRVYFELSSLDNKYLNTTLNTVDKTISLAPTDPKLYYNKALVLDTLGKKDEEIKTLQQALKLKPDYADVQAQLKDATASAK